MGKRRKEQMAVAGPYRGSGIYMSLPEWEAMLLPFTTPTTSLPSAFENPLQGASSLSSPTFVHPFANLPSFSSTHSTLLTLQPPSPLHFSRRNGDDAVRCPSFASSEESGFLPSALLHLCRHFNLCVVLSISSCNSLPHRRNYPGP